MTFPEGMKKVSVSVSKPGYLAVEQKVILHHPATFFDFGGTYGGSSTTLQPAP